jgi:hypothetical protein
LAKADVHQMLAPKPATRNRVLLALLYTAGLLR